MRTAGRESVARGPSSFMKPLARPGAGIANACGVPGTLGAVARTRHDGRAVLLSTWHVLFGERAGEESAVWLLGDDARSPIGRVLYGKAGTVDVGGERCWVDCAVASCDEGIAAATIARPDPPRAGERVTKNGAATGATSGVVVSAAHDDVAWIGGRRHEAPRQFLLRADDGPFCAAGDSGSLVVDGEGRAVGLLWGVNGRGEGLACPIAPVLYAMNITL